jgi:hypothetical protein
MTSRGGWGKRSSICTNCVASTNGPVMPRPITFPKATPDPQTVSRSERVLPGRTFSTISPKDSCQRLYVGSHHIWIVDLAPTGITRDNRRTTHATESTANEEANFIPEKRSDQRKDTKHCHSSKKDSSSSWISMFSVSPDHNGQKHPPYLEYRLRVLQVAKCNPVARNIKLQCQGYQRLYTDLPLLAYKH